MSLQTLPVEILVNICSFISFESLVYIFPYHAHLYYNKRYDYDWIIKTCLTHKFLRKRLLNWFVWKKIVPTNCLTINYICRYDTTTYILDKITKLLIENGKDIDKYFTSTSTDIASSNGNIAVLDYIYQLFGNKIKYTTFSIQMSIKYGHNNVLNWWMTRL